MAGGSCTIIRPAPRPDLEGRASARPGVLPPSRFLTDVDMQKHIPPDTCSDLRAQTFQQLLVNPIESTIAENRNHVILLHHRH